MRHRLELSPGDDLVVTVGGRSITVVYDDKKSAGVMDARGAWLPPSEDRDPYVFPVYEGAAAFADDGAQVDSMIAEQDGEEINTAVDRYDLGKFVQILFWLVRIHPLAASLLIIKAKNPTISTREMAQYVGLGRSQISELMGDLEQKFPRAFTLITGNKANAARGQRRRRARERMIPTSPRLGPSGAKA